MEIKFGTSGWRGIISKDFTVENLKRVSQAISEYFLKEEDYKKGIFIGYDTRFMSDRFANIVAVQLAKNKIPVYLSKRDVPTPVVAYTVINKELAGGINITASHNPPEYSGLKLTLSTGEPASLNATRWIEERINLIRDTDSLPSKVTGIRKIDSKISYLKRISKLVDVELIKKAKLKIGIDFMYGTSRGYLDDFLKEISSKLYLFHNEINPLFGGASPDPSPERLKELSNIVREKGLDIGLATDGDADRFGIIDRDGEYIPANYVLAVLFAHLLKTRSWKGGVVRSITTTHLLDAIALANGREVYEVPVGFKFVGPTMVQKGAAMGCEESGGMSVYGHIPEKDGILACLLMVEAVAYNRKKSVKELLKEIMEKCGYFCSKRIDLRLPEERKEVLLQKCRMIKEIGGMNVVKKEEFTKGAFRFLLPEGSWIIIRPSGTEPIVRCYIETNKQSRLKKLIGEVQKMFA